MSGVTRRLVAVATSMGVTVCLVAAGPPVEQPPLDRRAVAQQARQPKVPTAVSVESTGLFGPRARLTARAKIPVYRAHDVKRRQADRVVVYTEVVSPKGVRRGPREIADLDGKRDVSKAALLGFRKGVVKASIPLTARQRAAIARMRSQGLSRGRIGRQVRLVVEHQKDVRKQGVKWEHVGMAAAYVRLGKWAPKPGAALSGLLGGVRGNVLIRNTTDVPLTILAGPTSCVYDSLYDYDSTSTSSDQASQLGTLNGKVLNPGQTFAVAVEVNHNVYSNQIKTNDYGNPVLADYAKFLGAAIHDARLAGAPDLPSWQDADGDDDPSVEIDKELGEFVHGTLKNLLEATGLWDEFVEGLADEGLVQAALLAESVAAVDSMFEELGPLIAIAEMLYELFTSACSSNDGYAIIGATDAARPWRQFAQVYDMGSGHDKTIVPTIPPNTAHPSSVLTSLSNGLVSNNVAYQEPPNFLYLWSPFFNKSSTNSVLNEGNGAWSWNFAFPSTQAQRHADVSVIPGTRRVRCTQSEQGPLADEVSGLGVPSFMPAWPQVAWLNWDGTTAQTPVETTDIPRRPLDYAIGLHYIAADSSTASVRYTAQTTDPTSWATIAIPAGQDWVDIPAGSKAVWVGCDVQVPEIFPDLTAVGRYSVMGTQVPSDVIPGPDHS